ncbi:hypothetical protein ACSW29_23650 [Rhodococcus sp. GB-02]
MPGQVERGAAAGQRGVAGGERVFRGGDRPDTEEVMSFVGAHDFSAGIVLRFLNIASSTYYDWRARRTSPSLRRCGDERLLTLIEEIRASHEFAGTYGSPRVWLTSGQVQCAGSVHASRPVRANSIFA